MYYSKIDNVKIIAVSIIIVECLLRAITTNMRFSSHRNHFGFIEDYLVRAITRNEIVLGALVAGMMIVAIFIKFKSNNFICKILLIIISGLYLLNHVTEQFWIWQPFYRDIYVALSISLIFFIIEKLRSKIIAVASIGIVLLQAILIIFHQTTGGVAFQFVATNILSSLALIAFVWIMCSTKPVPQFQAVQAASGATFCGNCGKPIEDGAAFCDGCGVKM